MWEHGAWKHQSRGHPLINSVREPQTPDGCEQTSWYLVHRAVYCFATGWSRCNGSRMEWLERGTAPFAGRNWNGTYRAARKCSLTFPRCLGQRAAFGGRPVTSLASPLEDQETGVGAGQTPMSSSKRDNCPTPRIFRCGALPTPSSHSEPRHQTLALIQDSNRFL